MPTGSSVQPYSAPRARSLPTLTNQDPATVFANWNAQLADNVRNVAPQATPQNFTVTNAGGALTLNWGKVPNASGADGYEILKSQSGTFVGDLQIIPVKNVNQTTYVDNVGGSVKCSYRIRTTSGTIQNPQSQRGPESGVITHTSLAVGGTANSTTKLDTFTTDKSRSLARNGNYGAFKVAGQGAPSRSAAGSGVASGPAGGKSSGPNSIAPSPTTGSSGGGGSAPSGTTPVPFSSITSGVNIIGTMQVGNGAEIIPNSLNPGLIEATEAPWSGLFGDLFSNQFIPFDNTTTVGTPATTISQVVNGVLGIGTGVTSTTSTTGGLILTTATVLGVLAAAKATITTATVQTLVAPAAIITAGTITTATVQTLVAPAAIITAATITTATATALIATTATVTSSLSAGSLAVTSTVYDSLGLPGASAQVYTVSTTGLPQWEASASGFSNPMTTAGDLIYESAAVSATRLPIGSSNQVLTVSGGLPTWQNAGAGSLLLSVLTTNASYKPLSTDQLILFNATVAVTATLNSALSKGTNYIIKNTSTSSNVFIVTTSGVIDYQSNVELTALDSIDVALDGTNWWIT